MGDNNWIKTLNAPGKFGWKSSMWCVPAGNTLEICTSWLSFEKKNLKIEFWIDMYVYMQVFINKLHWDWMQQVIYSLFLTYLNKVRRAVIWHVTSVWLERKNQWFSSMISLFWSKHNKDNTFISLFAILDVHTDTQTHRHTHRHTDTQTDTHTHTHTHIHLQFRSGSSNEILTLFLLVIKWIDARG